MTALRIVCLVLVICGGVILSVVGMQYHRYLRERRAASYTDQHSNRVLDTVAQLTLLFFVAGFVVGAVDIARREVEPIYLFVSVVFFVGAVFIAAMIRIQMAMTRTLQEKALEVMRGFVNSIEKKDAYTQGHSWHVYHITRLFYERLPHNLRQGLNRAMLLDAALLHDIGKMAVPDSVLNKSGPLTDGEWEQIRAHPRHGKAMLESTSLVKISDWVLYHHERMDGNGYYGLPGWDIPLAARLIAVADTYSAITTDREYRPRRSHGEALAELRRAAGTQLDPQLVEVFCTLPAAELARLPAGGPPARPADGAET